MEQARCPPTPFILGQDLTGQLLGKREVEQLSQRKVIFLLIKETLPKYKKAIA